jgi:hypothetical protein
MKHVRNGKMQSKPSFSFINRKHILLEKEGTLSEKIENDEV